MNNILRNGKKGRKRKGRGKNSGVASLGIGKLVLLGFLGLLFLFMLVVFLFLKLYSPSVEPYLELNVPDELSNLLNSGDDSGDNFGEEPVQNNAVKTDRTGESYTFLFVGKDKVAWNTDTIMLATLYVKEKKIGILNIPRDTFINTANYVGKINGVAGVAYNKAKKDGKTEEKATESGMKALGAMVKYVFGVTIDKYVLINLEGFRALIDAVGGVDIDVPKRLFYEDPFQDLYIDIKAGYQHFDGKEAEKLARARYVWTDGDFGRIRMQQKIIAAVMKKCLKFDVAQINKLFEICNKYIDTNLTTADVGWFAVKAIEIKLENMYVIAIPGEEYKYKAESTVGIYKDKTMEIINKYVNPYKEAIPESNFNIYEPLRTYAHLAKTEAASFDSLIAGN